MVAYIKWADNDTDWQAPIEQTWHIGKNYSRTLKAVGRYTVVEIQADGDELEFIRHNVSSIPFINGVRVMNWYGDIARTIVHALYNYERITQ